MDSLIGSVPGDWRQTSLGEVCEVLAGPSGARLRLETRTSSTVPVIRPRDLRNNRITGAAAGVAADLAQTLMRFAIARGDIVCSRTVDLGRQALVLSEQDGWLIGSGCLRLRVRATLDATYFVYYLGHPAVRDWIARASTGSVIPSVSTTTLNSMPVVIPPAAVQSAIADVLGALDDKIAVHDQISTTAATLRDSVLPLLFAESMR
jgi:restriction endonuclease S subunit